MGIDLALETCGHFTWDNVVPVLDRMNHVFFDLKAVDVSLHKQLTGTDNALILENLRRMETIRRPDFRLVVRIPLVPGANDTEDNLRRSADFISRHLPGTAVELLAYHQLGNHKFDALNLGHLAENYRVPAQADMERAREIFTTRGVPLTEYR